MNGASAQLDMFGQVPVSRPDVYAWLLAVPDIDPGSCRAASYAEGYGVLDKIIAAKLAGTFDEIVADACATARYRELAASGKASLSATNSLWLGELPNSPISVRLPLKSAKRAPNRSRAEIERAQRRDKAAKRGRAKLAGSVLNRLMPSALPSFDAILADLGGPDDEAIATALRVSLTTVRKWVRSGEAPYAAKLALYWMTRQGVATIDANAVNEAMHSNLVARVRGREADELREQLHRMGQIADFGSANDPLPRVHARLAPHLSPASRPESSAEKPRATPSNHTMNQPRAAVAATA